ncbi:hypothetical protein ACNO8X_13950 [Mycobacterium sp. PDNC021]|uniref:hypothetical protein n=1 Tax=Mycobacterium sp. PDNC021 TaxID=3391399 RepID=UPI003AADB5B6
MPPRSVTVDVTPTATIDESNTTIGIADSSLYGLSPADIDATLTKLQSIGVQNIRVFVPWGLIEPMAQGSYNWSLMDNVMTAAAAHNMGVLAVVSSTPLWAAPSGTLPGAGAPNPQDYVNFMTQVVNRYGNTISAYEIWNEVNAASFYQPMNAASYTALLKAVYPVIKQLDPTATVVAGALAPLLDIGNLTASAPAYVAAMYAAGAQGFFDALSVHPYDFSQLVKFSQGEGIPLTAISQVEGVRALMVQNGDGTKLIWATEYGFQTVLDANGQVTDASNQSQSAFIQDMITAWRALTYTGPLYIYTTRDGTPGTDTGYGIYQADWTPKLAVAVIQQAIADALQHNPVTPPFVAFIQFIQKAIAQAQQAFASFTASLQTAFANAVKAFTDALSAIFKPAAAQPTTAASVTSAAATSEEKLAAAKTAITELKAQVSGSKDTAEHAKTGDKSESGDVTVVDAAEHEAAGAVDPKAADTKSEDTKTEEPKAETPKADETKSEVKTDTPKDETPKAEAPKAEAPKADTPKADTPKADTPKADTPKSDTTPSPANESKTQTKDGATQDKSDSGKAGTKGKTGKKPGKAKKQTPAAASEPAKPAGRANGDGGGKDSSTDSKTHQHQGS